ncbi:hypothetical protein BJAS_P2707 [Bathymodiolus japonicus methanotrophic gill symbiont]|uniref:hypothetical protein n=1 Tax=Bathymodiolus japonicus methanotrophic gill symbiont TaxID=113269 RepID=UPI001B6454DE|nr:hypothetical protein [Bathymodiolus japonicus methanotrophic gill symbiont]GFO72453.1 hypothetical protein BJAS_P2707 [Bathymodiolus japonicus methanotrophic gill symbiont]
MFEFIVVLLIAAAGWFYWSKKNNDIEGSSSIPEAKQPPETPQPEPSIEEPEVTAAEPEPVKTEQVVTELDEAVNEIPEDSALRRHFLQNQAAQDQKDIDSSASADAKDSVVEPVKPVMTTTEIPVEKEVKRDVIQQLVAETEATMPPRPTDSTLKRHYDTQLMSIVLSKLQESK